MFYETLNTDDTFYHRSDLIRSFEFLANISLLYIPELFLSKKQFYILIYQGNKGASISKFHVPRKLPLRLING